METGIRIYEMQDRNLQKKGNKMNKKAVACMMASAVFSMSGGSVSRSGDAIANWVNESVTVSK